MKKASEIWNKPSESWINAVSGEEVPVGDKIQITISKEDNVKVIGLLESAGIGYWSVPVAALPVQGYSLQDITDVLFKLNYSHPDREEFIKALPVIPVGGNGWVSEKQNWQKKF